MIKRHKCQTKRHKQENRIVEMKIGRSVWKPKVPDKPENREYSSIARGKLNSEDIQTGHPEPGLGRLFHMEFLECTPRDKLYFLP